MIITQTPMRVSFCGGGTDLPWYYGEHDGHVLSCSINQFVYLVVRRRADRKIVLRHLSGTEVVTQVRELNHELTRECLQLVGTSGGVDIMSMSDVVAEGTGLGASSAYTVGLLRALWELSGYSPTNLQLAELACHVEIERLAQPIGKQDQYAVALGGVNELFFERDGAVRVEPVLLSSASRDSLLAQAVLVNTGRARKAGEVLRKWRRSGLQDIQRLHAIKATVSLGKEVLVSGDVASLGELLHEGWQNKKALGGVTDLELDNMYDAALRAGAYGGKLLGAGGGGFFLFLGPAGLFDLLVAALPGYEAIPFGLSDSGCRILKTDK